MNNEIELFRIPNLPDYVSSETILWRSGEYFNRREYVDPDQDISYLKITYEEVTAEAKRIFNMGGMHPAEKRRCLGAGIDL